MLDGLLSLVIPAHNEVANMPGVIGDARRALKDLAPDHEIVLVDDGSTDSTAQAAVAAMGEERDRLRLVRHERKSGYGISVADGLRAARGDYVAFMDGDGQFAAQDLGKLADLIKDADLAAGFRIRRADPFYRSVISGVFNVLVRLLYRVHYRDIDCGLKLMRRSVLEAASPLLARSALLNTELYFKASRSEFRVSQVGIPHHPRRAGVRSGARLRPILRAIRELVRLRIRLYREWRPPARRTPPA